MTVATSAPEMSAAKAPTGATAAPRAASPAIKSPARSKDADHSGGGAATTPNGAAMDVDAKVDKKDKKEGAPRGGVIPPPPMLVRNS